MCHLDNMLQLPRLLLHLGCQEKRCWHHRLWRKTLCLLKRSLNSRLKQINQVDSQYSFRKRRLFESSHRQEREEGPSPCPNPFPRWAPHPGSSRSGFGVPSAAHPPDPSTYIPVELGEGLHHVEAVHVHDGRVDGELGAGKGVKEQRSRRRDPRAGPGEPLEQIPHPNSTRRGGALLIPRAGLPCIPAQLSPLLKRALLDPKTGSALPIPKPSLPDTPGASPYSLNGVSSIPNRRGPPCSRNPFWDLLGPKIGSAFAGTRGPSLTTPSQHLSTAFPAPETGLASIPERAWLSPLLGRAFPTPQHSFPCS